MDEDEPIYECNSQCGCGPECHNRVGLNKMVPAQRTRQLLIHLVFCVQVVGNRLSIPVDIFHTEEQGWAVRNSPDYAEDYGRGIFKKHKGKTIIRGQPLGIYSGEVITAAKSDRRSE